MKQYRRSWLAHLDRTSDQQRAQQALLRRQAEAQAAANPPPPKLNRKARRRNELFNRKLAEQLEKQNTPAQVKVLDDGGIHVTLSKEELEMRHAEEDPVANFKEVYEREIEPHLSAESVLPSDAQPVRDDVPSASET